MYATRRQHTSHLFNSVPKQISQDDSLSRKKNFLGGKLTKEKISSLGFYGFMSYGFVSNFSYVTSVIIAWCIHGKSTGLSPLSPGQWKPFLVVYAGIWAVNNFLRPARLTLALVITPFFESFVDKIQKRTGWKRSYCSAFSIFLVNVVGTISFLVCGLTAATAVLGLPLRV
jgi:hypothetical protein